VKLTVLLAVAREMDSTEVRRLATVRDVRSLRPVEHPAEAERLEG
jgi:hypothetical protein